MIAPKKIAVTIDGKRCEAAAGETILQIATANDIQIPTLCYLKHLSPWGGCRMCIVEIEGSPKVAPACSTPALDGSKITTNSDRLKNLRRATLELLFSERNHICPFCPMNKGDCELQGIGYQFGMDSVRFPYLYPALPVDLSGKFFGLDHNRCILCTRCVRTCDEIEGVHTLDISNRGAKNLVVVDLNATFGASETCTLCGACVAACPTGALFDKFSAFRGPLASCETVRTTCTECPVGCGLIVYTRENRIVDVFGDAESPVNRGHLCVRGRYETWAAPRARILHPLVRDNGKLVPATWEEALRVVKNAENRAEKSQKAALISPRLTNESAKFVQKIAQKFDRVGVFVAKNEAALCAELGFSSDALRQLENADAIIVLGAQPSREHGVIAAKIRVAVRKRGAKLLIFHARKSDLDVLADISANVVSLERKFWEQVADVLRDARRPVLIYGPNAMTPIGVTVLERLIKAFENVPNNSNLQLIALPSGANSLAISASGIEPLEEVAPWLDEKPLKFLHIAASDEPDGGARLLDERHVRALLEQIECVVVQASYESDLTDYAKVVLPAAIWCEKSGTVTNFEGRILQLERAVEPPGEAREDKTILESAFS
jgi:formate dehydrogenase major subunit